MLQEYFSIVEHIRINTAQEDKRIIIDSNIFYAMLDKNLYVKRKYKLQFYRQLNLIICNSKGFTSVVYDKDTKKTLRKVILNMESYQLIKKLYQIEIKM